MVEMIVGIDYFGRQRASVRYSSFTGDNFACFSFAIAATGRKLTLEQQEGIFKAAFAHAAHSLVIISLVVSTPTEALKWYRNFQAMLP